MWTPPFSSARLGLAAGLALALAALGCRDQTPKVKVTTSSSTAPRPIDFDPPNGASGVDPARTTLAVTFDREMDPQGWAWVIEGATTSPELGESSWDPATRTNTVRAKLEPGRDYVVWVNSPQYLYFKDRSGVPAEPTRWAFSTRNGAGATAAPTGAIGMVRSTPSGPPRVVKLEPPNGATDVDPETMVLRATFDRPMSEGWSWVIEQGAVFPETTGAASMSGDGLRAMLPVRLRPATTYVVWLNSEQHRDFADRSGVTLSPVRWSFTTRLAKP